MIALEYEWAGLSPIDQKVWAIALLNHNDKLYELVAIGGTAGISLVSGSQTNEKKEILLTRAHKLVQEHIRNAYHPTPFPSHLFRLDLIAPIPGWTDHSVQYAGGSSIPSTKRVGGRYEIEKHIGKGGFGAVYKATDIRFGLPVALKEMLVPFGMSQKEQDEAKRNFEQEAKMLRSLKHPGLPQIYDSFEENGKWYLAMEFIEGETLEERLEHTGKIAPKEALDLGLELCDILTYLHGQAPPIIFRDLKPANILIRTDGKVHLIDFGIARFFKPGQTKDTTAYGSTGYAAPEQYGKAQTTIQSDLYALGATLHTCLTGEDPSTSPFRFSSLVGKFPLELAQLVEELTIIDSEKRPKQARDVAERLELCQALLDNPQAAQWKRKKPAGKIPFPGAKSSVLPPKRNKKKCTILLLSAACVNPNTVQPKKWEKHLVDLLTWDAGLTFPYPKQTTVLSQEDRRMGTLITPETERLIKEADVILLPITARELLNSTWAIWVDVCADMQEEKLLIPILIEEWDWRGNVALTKIRNLPVLPKSGNAAHAYKTEEQGYLAIARDLSDMLKEWST